MDLARLTQKQVAQLLRVETDGRTVRRLHEEGLPFHGEGRTLFYVWDEVEPWWYERRVRKAGLRNSGAEGVPPQAVSEARKAAADAEIAEMKAQTMRGSHLDAAAVELVWTEAIGRAKGRLLSLAPRVAVQLVDGMTVPERKAAIEEGIFAALAELEAGDQAEVTA